MKLWMSLVCVLAMHFISMHADEDSDRVEQKIQERKLEDQRVEERRQARIREEKKVDEQRLERQREEDRIQQRKRDDEIWNRQHGR